jgi:hypothetical protein
MCHVKKGGRGGAMLPLIPFNVAAPLRGENPPRFVACRAAKNSPPKF